VSIALYRSPEFFKIFLGAEIIGRSFKSEYTEAGIKERRNFRTGR
jgi:hypothetical protein